MFYIFPLLVLTLITLLFYYNDKDKLNSRIDELVSDLEKEMGNKIDIESKYNQLLKDVKNDEETRKSKNIDEMQLISTKVNLLDDKITYFNTNFKSKLDQILKIIEDAVNAGENEIYNDEEQKNQQDINENNLVNDSEISADGIKDGEEDSIKVNNELDENNNTTFNDEFKVGDVFKNEAMKENGGDTLDSISINKDLSIDSTDENFINTNKNDLDKNTSEVNSNKKMYQGDDEFEEGSMTKITQKDMEEEEKEITKEELLGDRSILDADFLNEGCDINKNGICPIENEKMLDIKDDEITSALNELDRIEENSNNEENENNVSPTTILSEKNKDDKNDLEINDDDKISLDEGSFAIKDSIEKLKAQLEDNSEKNDEEK